MTFAQKSEIENMRSRGFSFQHIAEALSININTVKSYVVRCDNEVSSTIQAKTKVRVPFNGAVAIYCSGGKSKVYRKEDAFYGSSLD